MQWLHTSTIGITHTQCTHKDRYLKENLTFILAFELSNLSYKILEPSAHFCENYIFGMAVQQNALSFSSNFLNQNEIYTGDTSSKQSISCIIGRTRILESFAAHKLIYEFNFGQDQRGVNTFYIAAR